MGRRLKQTEQHRRRASWLALGRVAAIVLFALLTITAVAPTPSVAQDGTDKAAAAAAKVKISPPGTSPTSWPHYEIDEPTFRGNHGPYPPTTYLSVWKLLSCFFIFLCWVRTSDWVSQDGQLMQLNFHLWNPIVLGSFFAAILILLISPWFWLGFLLLLIAHVAPLSSYIYVRNSLVEEHERVLTPDHLRHWFASWGHYVGVKIEAEKKAAHEAGAPVELTAMGGATERDDQANLITARQSPGFVLTKELVADAVAHRADAISLHYTAEDVSIGYQIDGVWHQNQKQPRETADVMLAVMKTIAALDAAQRVALQEGHFGAEFQGQRYTCHLSSQGVSDGERVLVKLGGKTTEFASLEEVGMRAQMQEQIRALMDAEKGMLVLSAIPEGGLNSTFDTLLRSTDRFIREFVTIEDAHNPGHEIENVEIATFDSLAGETAADVLPGVLRKKPDVVILRNLTDDSAAKILLEQAAVEKMVIVSVRSRDASEALLRLLLLRTPAEQVNKITGGVLGQRLIRKLCPACKEAYNPTPELLNKLGIPPGKIEVLYRQPREVESVCPECRGVGYLGRTALFELLVPDDMMRQVLAKSPKIELVRKAARKAGMRSIQDHGILTIARGETSLEELTRVMKQQS